MSKHLILKILIISLNLINCINQNESIHELCFNYGCPCKDDSAVERLARLKLRERENGWIAFYIGLGVIMVFILCFVCCYLCKKK
ncbi:hypothetical protein TUBRATIS_30790 [Tubulinosema ratisbonensis]|uniref:Uncharacterized protein n=1 Tax=Tubulinosema ratisbonensis TaxID=291195 RepID=A0A437AHD8_9MICR|nr:hypothetical protein TUBRATIS_30790 [Tubulinosema ratisbonensis]